MQPVWWYHVSGFMWTKEFRIGLQIKICQTWFHSVIGSLRLNKEKQTTTTPPKPTKKPTNQTPNYPDSIFLILLYSDRTKDLT